MASEISPKAEIDPRAKIGNNCKIYPFAYIEGDVEIGDGCTIYPFVSILNGTHMGKNNMVFQGAVLGALPQDFDFIGEKSELVIGDRNVFRENVVINRATHSDGKTVIGNANFFMEGAHISHDTKVGHRCVFGYGTKIAGDCEIGDAAIFSTSVIANARTRVGACSMVRSGCTFSKDIPPFIIAGNSPIKYCGINSVMMSKYGLDAKTQKHVANAYRLVFHGQTSVFDAVLQIKEQVPDGESIRMITSFIEGTKLGIISKI